MMIRLQVRVTEPELRIRSGPSTDFAHIGDLRAGSVLNVRTITGDNVRIGFDPAVDISGNDVWVEFAPGQWAAYAYQSERYMVLHF